MPWYALQVRSNSEDKVHAFLGEQRVDDFAPSYEIKVKRFGRGKPIIHRRPLFPGYIFGNFAWRDRGPVLRVPQIIRVVGYGDTPVEITDTDIAAVRKLAECPFPVVVQPIDYTPNVGEWVRVTRGPLEGYEGAVVFVKGKGRLVVSIHQIHRSVCVEVDSHCLERVRARRVLSAVSPTG